MKSIVLLLPFVLFAFLSCKQQQTNDNTVNPVLGDISYVEKFRQSPTTSTNEQKRITTHLTYVEKSLRNKNISHLNPDLRKKREYLLDLLHDYISAGSFPRNYDHPGKRMPCFIDKDGNICAVGYLIEKTAGRAAAEKINSKHQYERILAMNDAMVDNWVEGSGLTLEECAMIQPSYGYQPVSYSDIPTSYGVSSAVLGGVNLSLNALNTMQLLRGGSQNKLVPAIGLAAGIGQIVLGATNMPKEEQGWNNTYINTGKKSVSLINIGLGTATTVLSAWNLLSKPRYNARSVSWNVYSFPTPSGTNGVGFSMTKKI